MKENYNLVKSHQDTAERVRLRTGAGHMRGNKDLDADLAR